jgi:hypothetical protein
VSKRLGLLGLFHFGVPPVPGIGTESPISVPTAAAVGTAATYGKENSGRTPSPKIG